MSSVKKETISGVKWGMLQKLTMQPLQLIYGMVLARLITPEEMGIVGLTAIFFAIADQMANAGFGAALIRKIDRTETDCCTMFWFNIAANFVVCSIPFMLAPWFSRFYNQPELLWLTRASAFNMFISSTTSVHWSLYSARRDFKTPAIVGSIVTIAGMPVCLGLAWQGLGVWALMWQSIFSTLLSLAVIWIISPWKPHFIFSLHSFKQLFGFGCNLAIGGILHVFYQNIRTFIIGKFYSPTQLGLYSRGVHITTIVPNTLTGIICGVSYPVLSTLQNDDTRLCQVYRKYIKTSTLIIAWVSISIFALGKPAVVLLYGEDWLGCTVFMQIIALGVAVDHLCGINLHLLMVKGRSDLLLRLEILKKTISLTMLFYAATISVEAICWASVIYTHLAIFINTYYTGKILGLNWWLQQKDIMPYVFLASATCVPAWFCAQTNWPSLLQLAAGGGSAFILYFGTLHILKEAAYVELYTTLRGNRWFRWLPAI